MYWKGITTHTFFCVLLVTGLFSCKNATDVSSSFSLNLRLPNEPESLHPIFSKSSNASPIESLILLPITEYDPFSLTLTPLLITKMPVPEMVTEGKHANGKVFNLEFRPEAEWADGKPVTGEDYLFTIKSIYNPYVNADSWTAPTSSIMKQLPIGISIQRIFMTRKISCPNLRSKNSELRIKLGLQNKTLY